MPADTAPIWVLLGQLADQAESVTVAGGYRTDIGLNVSREPEAQVVQDPDETPARLLVGLSSAVVPGDLAGMVSTKRFDVALEASVPADSQDAQAVAHAALADLFDLHPRSRVYLQSSTIETEVTPGPGEVLTRPEGLPIVVAVLTLRCVMRGKVPVLPLPDIGPP